MKYFYDNLVLSISKKIAARFEDLSADYNFDLGDEFEIAVCELLRSFLPTKYGICRGFVVDKEGQKAGDDIVIFDQIAYPTLKLIPKNQFDRKENIPIEAVYAYIEAKHRLNIDNFQKSLDQVCKVKKLCAKRKPSDLFQIDPYMGQYINRGNVVEAMPKYRNPVIGIVLSKYCVNLSNQTSDIETEISDFLSQQRAMMLKNDYNPELIIAGNSNLMAIGFKGKNADKPTLFLPDNGFEVGYQNLIRKEFAFGIFFFHLIAALDWIRLTPIPWVDLLNESKLE